MSRANSISGVLPKLYSIGLGHINSEHRQILTTKKMALRNCRYSESFGLESFTLIRNYYTFGHS